MPVPVSPLRLQGRSVPVPVGYPAFPARRPAPIPAALRPAIKHSGRARSGTSQGRTTRQMELLPWISSLWRQRMRGNAKASSSPLEIPLQTSLFGAGVAQDGLTAPRDAGRVEFPGRSTATMSKPQGPQGTPSLWEWDIPDTTPRVGSHEVTVAASGATRSEDTGTHHGAAYHWCRAVHSHLGTRGEERRGVSTWLLLALSSLPHSMALLCQGCGAPAWGLHPL